MKNQVCLALTSISAALISINTSAKGWNIDLEYGKGLSDDPVREYNYVGGYKDELIPGDGFTFLLGRDLASLGPVTVNVRSGFHWGGMSHDGKDANGDDLYRSDSFTYVPVLLNARFNFTSKLSISGGLSYLALPRFNTRTDGKDINGNDIDTKLKVKLSPSAGYNVELKYMPVKKGEESPITAGYFLSYTKNLVSYDSVEVEGIKYDLSSFDKADVSTINFGLSIGF